MSRPRIPTELRKLQILAVSGSQPLCHTAPWCLSAVTDSVPSAELPPAFTFRLLWLQLVAVAIAAMAFQLDLVRRVCKQRMACFSVFLAMPSATIRTMAVAPCRVSSGRPARPAALLLCQHFAIQ